MTLSRPWPCWATVPATNRSAQASVVGTIASGGEARTQKRAMQLHMTSPAARATIHKMRCEACVKRLTSMMPHHLDVHIPRRQS